MMTSARVRCPQAGRALKLALAASVAALIAACGGGGGDSAQTSAAPATPAVTASPTAFSGPITGFGSIFVNGVRIDNSSARTTLDDDNPNAGADDLRLGMVVEVQGERDSSGTTGRATAIASRSFVQGPVASVNAAGGSLVVLGITVTVSPSTVFDGRNSFGSLNDLAAGDIVEVHGLPDADGTHVKATRLERKSPGTEIRLTGVARNVASGSFTINGVTVQYTPSVLDNLPSGLANGAVVRVKGTQTGPAAITATRVRGTTLVPLVVQGQRAEVEGVATAVRSATDFDLSGLRVTVPATATVRGTPVVGARIEVKGAISNGVLVATSVNVEDERQQENEANELHANVASIDRSAQTFTVNVGGLRVQWNSATVFENATLPRGADDLAVGMRLEIKGRTSGNVIIASRIKRDN